MNIFIRKISAGILRSMSFPILKYSAGKFQQEKFVDGSLNRNCSAGKSLHKSPHVFSLCRCAGIFRRKIPAHEFNRILLNGYFSQQETVDPLRSGTESTPIHKKWP